MTPPPPTAEALSIDFHDPVAQYRRESKPRRAPRKRKLPSGRAVLPVWMTDAQRDALATLAGTLNISTSALIRMCISYALPRVLQDPDYTKPRFPPPRKPRRARPAPPKPRDSLSAAKGGAVASPEHVSSAVASEQPAASSPLFG